MKIVAIRIKNLASLEGVTEIDFTREPLCSAGIFAITGQTGAGKSTILDALCLALYGKTPRYLQAKENGIDVQDVAGSTIRQDDVRGILRDGTADGYAEVDFIGVDDQHYRANWSVRRSRNKIEGSLQNETVTLANISSHTAFPSNKKTEVLKETERLVGLNFEQFTRSVLLAQGDFTAFLKAGKDDKSSLLEKLTGTQIYSDISKLIFEKCRTEEQQLHDLHLKKEGIVTLSDAEITELEEQLLAFKTEIIALEKQHEAVSREIAWHERLVELQGAVANAAGKQEAAITEKQNSRDREIKLQLVERVQPTRTWADALAAAAKQLQEKNTVHGKLQAQLEALQQQKQLLETRVTNAAETFAAKNEDYKIALPLLDLAKQLDGQLTEKQEQVTDAQTDLQKSRKEQEQHQALVKVKQEEGNALGKSIETLGTWRVENIARQPVAENSALIISKLKDAEKWVLANQSITNAIAVAEGKQQQTIKQQNSLQKELELKSAAALLLQKEYDKQLRELDVIPAEALEKEKREADNLVEQAITAQSHWALLFETQTSYHALQGKFRFNQDDLAAKEILLRQVTEQMTTVKTQKETSAAILEKAKLTLADSVESLRTRLVNGEPCPVCGSTEHPYALHDPRLDLLLSQLEADYNHLDKTYTSLLKEHSGLERSTTDLQKTISQLQKEIGDKAPALELLVQTWQGFALYQECLQIPDEEKSPWLQQQVKTYKNRQTLLQLQIQDYNNNRKKLETQKQAIGQLEKEQNETDNKIKDAARNLASLQDTIDRNQEESKKLHVELLIAVQFLDPYFPQSDWYSNWKSNPSAFIKKIEVFTAEWLQKNNQLEVNGKSLGMLNATIAELNLQSGKHLQEVNSKATHLKNIENIYNDLRRQRAAIFNGMPAATVGSQFRDAIETAAAQLKKSEEELATLETNLTKTSTQLEETERQIADLANDITSYQQRIKTWLLNHNEQYGDAVDEALLQELLLYTPEWIEQERTALGLLEIAVTKALSVLNERSILLQQHEAKCLSDQSLEALTLTLAEAKQTIDEAVKNRNEITFKLQLDKDNKTKIGGLLEKIAAQALITENWSKLNEVIGSADGKKFRQVAQEYTLDVLLSFANHHLETLTKRYKMQRIPNSLGLQVLDQDMGDEIRTVFSLSGGESFLVSLALALGLASLSSSRMKVESLFIDEGFGSLDPATLNIAMDALERLHNLGRKVGVISHVQEMTERIPVQIKVSKQNSGRSKVEVVGV
jgi:exonuclease SbcC